jgi:Trk-type K+ transport system membrane component
MFTGRLGPLVLALAMAPKEDEVEAYRFVQEQVRIG